MKVGDKVFDWTFDHPKATMVILVSILLGCIALSFYLQATGKRCPSCGHLVP